MRITIKLGGSILEEAETRLELLSQIAALALKDHEIILVHGGGKSLNRRLAHPDGTKFTTGCASPMPKRFRSLSWCSQVG